MILLGLQPKNALFKPDMETSSAGSATLGDTSWATVILQLGSSISWGGHRTYFVDEGGTIWVGTPHNIERKSLIF